MLFLFPRQPNSSLPNFLEAAPQRGLEILAVSTYDKRSDVQREADAQRSIMSVPWCGQQWDIEGEGCTQPAMASSGQTGKESRRNRNAVLGESEEEEGTDGGDVRRAFWKRRHLNFILKRWGWE